MRIGATAVVPTHNPRVGRRSLRPVDPAVFEGDLLRRVVAGRQSGNERGNLPGLGIDGHDARAVVLGISCRRADGLVRVRGEESPALEAFLERDVDRRAVRLETSAPGHSGFPLVWAVASVGTVSTSANETVTQLNRSNVLRMSTPSQRYPAFFQGYAAYEENKQGTKVNHPSPPHTVPKSSQ